MLIYKEKLPLSTSDFKIVTLPYTSAEAAREAILKLGLQRKTPYMWFQADTGEKENEYLILAIGTGHNWGNRLKRNEYIGSIHLTEESPLLHYFLIDVPAPPAVSD